MLTQKVRNRRDPNYFSFSTLSTFISWARFAPSAQRAAYPSEDNQIIEQILGLTKDELEISVHTRADQNMSHTESNRKSGCHSSLVDVESKKINCVVMLKVESDI